MRIPGTTCAPAPLALAVLLMFSNMTSLSAEPLSLWEPASSESSLPVGGQSLPPVIILAEAKKSVSGTEDQAATSSSRQFQTLPPGAKLPSGSACAAKIRHSTFEPRPENTAANHTRGKAGTNIDGADADFNRKYASRVDGNFVGT